MKKTLTKGAAFTAILLMTSASMADDLLMPDDTVLGAQAFAGADYSEIALMNESAMQETEGQLWPLVGGIAAIVGVDIALSSYFWGVYVPSAGGAGKCPSCTIPTPSHR